MGGVRVQLHRAADPGLREGEPRPPGARLCRVASASHVQPQVLARGGGSAEPAGLLKPLGVAERGMNLRLLVSHAALSTRDPLRADLGRAVQWNQGGPRFCLGKLRRVMACSQGHEQVPWPGTRLWPPSLGTESSSWAGRGAQRWWHFRGALGLGGAARRAWCWPVQEGNAGSGHVRSPTTYLAVARHTRHNTHPITVIRRRLGDTQHMHPAVGPSAEPVTSSQVEARHPSHTSCPRSPPSPVTLSPRCL